MEVKKKIGLRMEDLTRSWMKKYLMSVNNAIGSGTLDRTRDIQCWSMYFSKQKNKSYDYLTTYGDFDIPVNVRFTSIVRPNIDWLISTYLGNAFNFSTKVSDKKSLEKKYQQKTDMLVETIKQGIEEKYLQIQTQLQLIGNKREELNALMQQQPENEEQAQQLETLKQQLPMINMKISQMSNMLERELTRSTEKMDKANLLSKFKVQDLREDLIQRKLVSFYEDNNIGNVHKQTMTEKCVTGKPYIFVDIVDGKLIYKNLPAVSVYHSTNSHNPNAEEGSWECYEEYVSYDAFLSEFGNELTARDLELLEPYSPHFGTNSNNIEAYMDSDNGAGNYVQSFKPTISRNNIRVLRVYFQANVQIDVLKSFTADKQYELTKLKKDTDIVREGQRDVSRFKNYTFQGTIALGSIYVGMKMRDKQLLSVDQYGWNQLPIIGQNFDDVTRVPYSIIWATKDLQAMYQIIEYYEELLLVISGVKGFVMDKSQMPAGMSEKEHAYFRKLGTLYIETYKKERRQQTTFNQFQTFDDSIPASIQYLGQMKDRIKSSVDQLTGVSRIARGETRERDAVGSSKLSVQATNIIADVLFWEHDQIVRRALSRAMNLYAKFIGKDGEVFSMFDKTVGDHDVVKIPKGLLDGADFDVVIMNNNKDIRDIQELKSVINAEYGRGNVEFSGLLKIFQATSLTEMRILSEQMAEKAQEMKMNIASSEANAQKELLDYEHQLAMQLKEADNQLASMNSQLKKLDLDIKEKKIIIDKEIAEKKIASDNYIKVMDILIEQEKDSNRLEAETNSVKIDQFLKQVEIYSNLALGQQKNMIDDKKLDKRVNQE